MSLNRLRIIIFADKDSDKTALYLNRKCTLVIRRQFETRLDLNVRERNVTLRELLRASARNVHSSHPLARGREMRTANGGSQANFDTFCFFAASLSPVRRRLRWKITFALNTRLRGDGGGGEYLFGYLEVSLKSHNSEATTRRACTQREIISR